MERLSEKSLSEALTSLVTKLSEERMAEQRRLHESLIAWHEAEWTKREAAWAEYKAEQKAAEEKRAAEQKAAEEKRAAEQKAAEEKRAAEHADFRESMKSLNKSYGDMSNSIGRLTESMFSNFRECFSHLGYGFTGQTYARKFLLPNGKALAEADFSLDNGKHILLVEVKTKMNADDINEHMARLERIRDYLRSRGDERKILGAMATGIAQESALEYAHKMGLFVLVPSGEAVSLVTPPESFVAREW